MDNEIRKYCEQCKFYSTLGCQSTLICTNGNKFWVADVQPVNRWISVKDKLPEQDEKVLVYTKDKDIMTMIYKVVPFRWYKPKFGGFDKDYVTHWKPLPEPPKPIKG